MESYHKINTVYMRDPNSKYKTLLEDQYSIPEFEYLRNNIWEWSEKINGTNIRWMWDWFAKRLILGGKTDRAQIPQGLVNNFQDRKLEEKFASMFPDADVVVYSEGFGVGIQKGGNYLSYQDFVVYDVKVGHWWLKRADVESIAKSLDVGFVPIIGEGTLSEMVEMTREGFNSQWGDFIAEGIVARPKVELKARNGERIIVKIKHEDFK